MTSPTLDLVETGAHLHDLGKLLLPKELLNAPRKLEEEERAQINTHAALGWAMVQLAGFEPVICEIVRHHHERYDGNGYPDHLTAEQIPLGARLVAICDVFAALTHPRPYRAAYTRPFARKFLQAGKGQAFDPPLVDLFCEQVMP
jgi:putative nucleotidyltransferase with HDIG domain